MNRITSEKRAAIVSALTEGNSLRSTARMVDVSRNTVDKLLRDLGIVCSEYQDRVLRNLPCKRIQVDEAWSFCYAKAKNVPQDKRGQFGYGDVWTWAAICADTKIVPCWLVAGRDAGAAREFIADLASRLANRVQLTSDGHKPYLTAVADTFGGEIDYAMLWKVYGPAPAATHAERKYSPNECIGCEKRAISGNPDPKHVSTSYAERLNLTLRMRIRRFTRLTNAFSKKVENHAHAVALHFFHYNFIRIHQTLRCTPAMRAGVTDRVWKIADLIDLLEKSESNSN